MAGNTYVTKNYSTYNIPDQRGGYDVVETKGNERVPASMVGYTDSVDSLSKLEPLKEYGHTPIMSGESKYTPKKHYDDYESNYKVNVYENSSPPLNPNKYTHGYFSEEPSGVHSGPGYVKTGIISSPNKSWQVAGPLSAHHSLTKSANDTNEALEIPEEYEYYAPRAHPRQREVLDDLSTFSQSFKPQSAYENYAFVSKLESGHEHAHGWHSFVPKLQGGHGYEDGYYAFVPKRQSGHGYNTAYVPKPNGAHYNFTTRYTYQPRENPWARWVLDDIDSDEDYTVNTSPPEPRRLKQTKGTQWWKTKTN